MNDADDSVVTYITRRLYSVHYWVSCVINKGGFFEIAFVSTHICLALRRLLTFCLTLTR